MIQCGTPRRLSSGTDGDAMGRCPPQIAVNQRSDLLRVFHLTAMVAVIVIGGHWPVLQCGALWLDDREYVTENPLVQHPCFASAKQFFSEILNPSTVGGYYQPLTMVSLMADYALRGHSDTLYPFHRTALTIHVANTMLIIFLLNLLFRNPWAAALSGLLFGIHPVTAETVAWISERKTLLATFFSFLSLICYVLYAQRGQRCFYVCSTIMYLLALLCKPIAIMLPVFMILLDVWPLRRSPGIRQMIVGKAPLFAICMLSAVVTYMSQSNTGGVQLPAEYGAWRIPLVACYDVAFYLHKIFWPVLLSAHYPFPEPFTLFDPKVFWAVAGTCLIAVSLIVSLRWSRVPVVCFLMFFLMLLPTMQIVSFSNEIAADRFLYLPSLGLLVLLTSFSSWLFRKINAQRTAITCSGLLAILLALATAETHSLRSYLAHWRETRALCEHTLRVNPYAHKARNNLGVALVKQGKVSEAIKQFKLATQFAGDPIVGAISYANLGLALVETGKTQRGIDCLRKVAYTNPTFPLPTLRLAWILATHPDPNVITPAEAVELAERVAQVGANRSVNMLDTLAAAYAANSQFAQAVETAKKALYLAKAKNMGSLSERIRERIQLYRSRQRYREDPTVAAWAKASP